MSSNGINMVILLGKLARDPEFRNTDKGTPVANLTIVTKDARKDEQTGVLREKVSYHRTVVFGKRVNTIKKLAQKGTEIYIEGQLQTRKWKDTHGNTNYTTEVIVQSYNGKMLITGGKKTMVNEAA